jgi:endonuclease G
LPGFFPRAVTRRSWLVAGLALLASACSDHPTATVPAPAGGESAPSELLTCTVSVKSGAVACSPASEGGQGGPSRTLYGGQNTLVRLTSSNVQIAGGVASFDVTVTNLLADQAIGTRDGVTLDSAGVRVFFASGPTVTAGSGSVSVANADGDRDFTGLEQPFFQYNAVIAPGATSAAKPWRFTLAGTVESFTFKMLIATEAQARLVISEVMANPGGAVQDSVGEYVEVYNAGRFPVNLRGFYLRDNGSAADTIKSDVMVQRGGYAVLGRSTDTSKNGGIQVDYAFTGRIGTTSTNLTFSNSGSDRFVIRSGAGVLLDSVSYTSSGTVAKNGIARELVNLAADNTLVDGSAWADAVAVYDAANSNKGTPRRANGATDTTTVPTAGPVVSVTVSPASQTLAPGATRQYTASGRDAGGLNSASTYTWESTSPSVATVSASGLVTAVANGTTTIRATSANGVMGSTTLTVATPSTSAVYRNHLEFGVPMDADSSNDIRLNKAQYALSYNAARGQPNWVSWNLNATHFGTAARCDCFLADESLPAGVTRITTSDYVGSGYSRGHMVMSEQRTTTASENAATFLMTNILPQLQDMNGGPWLKFEVYTNDLARTGGKEVYNIAGGLYGATRTTLKGEGKVDIPTYTWKIIVVMNGGEGLANVTSASSIQVIAVVMPNQAGIQSNGWEMYRTSVDALEAATGYDFLANLPDAIEAAVEAQN